MCISAFYKCIDFSGVPHHRSGEVPRAYVIRGDQALTETDIKVAQLTIFTLILRRHTNFAWASTSRDIGMLRQYAWVVVLIDWLIDWHWFKQNIYMTFFFTSRHILAQTYLSTSSWREELNLLTSSPSLRLEKFSGKNWRLIFSVKHEFGFFVSFLKHEWWFDSFERWNLACWRHNSGANIKTNLAADFQRKY